MESTELSMYMLVQSGHRVALSEKGKHRVGVCFSFLAVEAALADNMYTWYRMKYHSTFNYINSLPPSHFSFSYCHPKVICMSGVTKRLEAHCARWDTHVHHCTCTASVLWITD